MKLNQNQLDALKDFCDLILCGHHEDALIRCREHMENADDEYGGIPNVLYLLSGMDSDPDDPWGNVADEEKQVVKPQYYFVSSDAGAPDLEDFFWYIDNIKAARGLSFPMNRDKFSDNSSIVEWLAELAGQLDGLYLVNFDGGGDDYHFTILNKEGAEKAMYLFKRLTAHIAGYSYSSCVITKDFPWNT